MKGCGDSWRVVMIHGEVCWIVTSCDEIWRVVMMLWKKTVMTYDGQLWWIMKNSCDALWKTTVMHYEKKLRWIMMKRELIWIIKGMRWWIAKGKLWWLAKGEAVMTCEWEAVMTCAWEAVMTCEREAVMNCDKGNCDDLWRVVIMYVFIFRRLFLIISFISEISSFPHVHDFPRCLHVPSYCMFLFSFYSLFPFMEPMIRAHILVLFNMFSSLSLFFWCCFAHWLMFDFLHFLHFGLVCSPSYSYYVDIFFFLILSYDAYYA